MSERLPLRLGVSVAVAVGIGTVAFMKMRKTTERSHDQDLKTLQRILERSDTGGHTSITGDPLIDTLTEEQQSILRGRYEQPPIHESLSPQRPPTEIVSATDAANWVNFIDKAKESALSQMD